MKRKTIIEIIFHFIFWLLSAYYFTTNSFLRFPSMDGKEEYFSLCLIIIVIYSNYIWLIPRFFNTQHFFKYFLIISCFVIFITSLEFLMLKDDIKRIVLNTDVNFQRGVFLWNYSGILFRDALFVSFFTMFKIYRDAIKTNKLLKEVIVLEKQKMRAEINMVKSKVNAHFFFNTLNSIYAQALEQSEKTAELIVNLSDLMRYVVADSEHEWVTLDKEIEFLQNYIALETERHLYVDVSFVIEGNTLGFKVPPMIFEAFVNNAFKYTNDEGNGYVHMKLECFPPYKLQFSCSNNTRTTTKTGITSTAKGMKNTLERLKLFYPEHHQLSYGLKDGIYRVSLELFD